MNDILQLAREAGALISSAPGQEDGTAFLFSANELSAFRDAVLEEAAKKCDQHEQLRWNAYKKSPTSYVEGLSDGAGECAEAIRAMKGQP